MRVNTAASTPWMITQKRSAYKSTIQPTPENAIAASRKAKSPVTTTRIFLPRETISALSQACQTAGASAGVQHNSQYLPVACADHGEDAALRPLHLEKDERVGDKRSRSSIRARSPLGENRRNSSMTASITSCSLRDSISISSPRPISAIQ